MSLGPVAVIHRGHVRAEVQTTANVIDHHLWHLISLREPAHPLETLQRQHQPQPRPIRLGRLPSPLDLIKRRRVEHMQLTRRHQPRETRICRPLDRSHAAARPARSHHQVTREATNSLSPARNRLKINSLPVFRLPWSTPYTPFGVRCFGTSALLTSSASQSWFLYALRREVFRNSSDDERAACGGFYTPFGVRCFGTTYAATAVEPAKASRDKFLYALRREVFRNTVADVDAPALLFLYALQREVFRNLEHRPEILVPRKFLYALRREVFRNDKEFPAQSAGLFLYALRREVFRNLLLS